MEIREFEEFLDNTKAEFKVRLPATERFLLPRRLLANRYEECTSVFEEETFIANMKETFEEMVA